MSSGDDAPAAPPPLSPAAPFVTLAGRRFELTVFATENERRTANLALDAPAGGRGALLLWPRERFLKLETAGIEGLFYDVAFLDRSYTIVELGELDGANPEGLVPRVEAASALLLARRELEKAGAGRGDHVALEGLPSAEDLPLMKVGGVEARVELPMTSEECRRGLMFRPRMSADEGMFFDNGVERPGLNAWMKNTLIPLDVAFFKEDGTLINVHEMAPAEDPRAGPWPPFLATSPARFVLEMNAGWFKKKGLMNAEGGVRPGTRAEFSLETLRRLAEGARRHHST